MYARSFGLTEEPFGVSPDPRFLYCSAGHADALASLHYGLAERRGLMVLLGRPGLGKTTLLHYLIERWKDRAETAFLFHPPETRGEMIAAVLADLGQTAAAEYAENFRRLAAVSVECRRRGRRLILIFDEAQKIPPEVLEEIRLLSNLESPEEKLVDVILAGQPALADRLAETGHESLQQRAAVWAQLQELDAGDVRRYVEHRLSVAGCKRRRLFRGAALKLVAQASRGVPRNINTICHESLALAFSESRRKASEADVRRVLTGPLAGAPQQAAPRRLRWAAAAVFAAAAVGAVGSRDHLLLLKRTEAAPGPAEQQAIRRTPETVPAVSAPLPETEPAQPEVDRVEVRRGDTLRQIALRKYGEWGPRVWRRIQEANPGLSDADLVKAGQILLLPED